MILIVNKPILFLFIKRSLPFLMKMKKLLLLLKTKAKTKRRRTRRLNPLQRETTLMGSKMRRRKRKGSLETLMRRPMTASPKDLRLRRKLQTPKVNKNGISNPFDLDNMGFFRVEWDQKYTLSEHTVASLFISCCFFQEKRRMMNLKRWTLPLLQMRRKVCTTWLGLKWCSFWISPTHFTNFVVHFAPGQKDEKESGKTEEAGKLQNGESAKDSAAGAATEERKKAKTRFMFNIADGGFTGKISCSDCLF